MYNNRHFKIPNNRAKFLYIGIIVQVTLSIFFIIGCQKDSPVNTSKYYVTINGNVYDSNDSTYINNAIVMFNEFVDTTINGGSFSFDSIPVGEYNIEISHPFYKSFKKGIAISEDRSDKFYLDPINYFIADTLFSFQGTNYSPWHNDGSYSFTVKQTKRLGPEITIFSSRIFYDGLFTFDTLAVFNKNHTTPIDSFFIAGDRYVQFDVSDNNANLAIIRFKAKHDNNSDFDKEIIIDTRENISEWVNIFYSDRPVKITGMRCSTNGSICIRTDLDLVKGWNYILESHDTGSGYVVVNYFTPSTEQDIRWLFVVKN